MTDDREPTNDNTDPFASADTALAELYQTRHELLACDTTGRPLSWWRDRQKFLEEFEKAERYLLQQL